MQTAIFILFQYIVPKRLLSRLADKLAECQVPWFKDRLIRWFIRQYQVDMSIASNPDPHSYRHFNDFFTRALATGKRPIAAGENTICCPADGRISQIRRIQQGRIFQAKGQEYSLLELVGADSTVADQFQGGSFATLYLSPKDYHRVHIPLDGTLEQMMHIPGELFSVNDTSAKHVPRLFARNERVLCIFATKAGPMAVIMVGAMIVASIETVWSGLITPQKKQVRTWCYRKAHPLKFNKGDEIGRFKLGSTVIVLFGKEMTTWSEQLSAGSTVKMGQAIGNIACE
ncbi:MAG: archaetidylserine decarboxylase [Pseudomonadota bacterium]